MAEPAKPTPAGWYPPGPKDAPPPSPQPMPPGREQRDVELPNGPKSREHPSTQTGPSYPAGPPLGSPPIPRRPGNSPFGV